MSLETTREDILRMFGFQDVIKYSVATKEIDASIDWDLLEYKVRCWWRFYRDWEKNDSVAKAYDEQRLTVKGAHLKPWSKPIQSRELKSETPRRKLGLTEEIARPDIPENEFGKTYWALRKDLKSIQERFDPKKFVPQKGVASQKTEFGLHDLSAGLMHKGKPISEQQYKTPSADEYYVFMPLSHAGDQAVFQNIQRLAKCYRTQHGAFYDLVRDIRSKMTRIKLAAEHDMATNFVRVARQQPDDARPKFKFSLMEKTDVSIRDKGKGLELKLTTSVLKPPEQVTFDGDSKVKQANVTPEILQARQVAAINFQKLILGELHSYGEVVVAYRQHKGAFPKFAQFDDTSKLWKVGTLGADGHTFNFTGETIPDQPKLT